MFVCPALCAYIGPKFCFVRACNAHSDIAAVFSCGLFNRPIHDIADFDWSIVAGTQQVQRCDACEWAHFMQHLGPAAEKEALDHIQRGLAQLLEDAEAKSLSDWGVDAI